MKYLTYILRNARRNPVRSLLTIGSVSVSLFLMMILASFFTINDEVSSGVRIFNRIITMSSQGLGQPQPISRVAEIGALDGVECLTPFSWYGGKLGEEVMPFAQFGVDPATIFQVYSEIRIPEEQIQAFQEDRTGCVIGSKLAEDRGWKIGDRVPLKGDIYPVDLDLTIRGIYDADVNRDRRMLFFNWYYLEESLKANSQGRAQSGNAGVIFIKCRNAEIMPTLSKQIDQLYANSDSPTRTQTEEAFGKMFQEYWGNLSDMIQMVGMAVVFSLICVSGNAMAIAMRERTTEVAVLKAIGFGRGLVVSLVLAEAMIIAGIGGLIGAIGSKVFFDYFDAARYTSGFLPFFYVPLNTALLGLAISVLIGFASGFFPAINAARLSVVNGLRKVV